MRSRWIRFIALFMLAYALFDVCTPESCAIELPIAAQSGSRVQANHDGDSDSSCAFEEDCLACAHFLPGAHFPPHSLSKMSFAEPEIYFPTLDGASAPPYRPPRA